MTEKTPKDIWEEAIKDLSPKDREFIEKIKKQHKELPIWLEDH